MLIKPYKAYADLMTIRDDDRLLESPGSLSRMEPATGLLVRGIQVNGHYLIVESCDVFQRQDIDMKDYIQGGPRSSIADIDKKYVEGQIVCPMRVDRNGNLENAVLELLRNAQRPFKAMRIDTNHALSHYTITAEHGGTDDNELLSFDCMLIKELRLTAAAEGAVKITASVIGSIESRTASNLLAPPDSYRLGRELTFADCDASRFQSAMRTISTMEIKVTNQVELLDFMVPGNVDERYDRPSYIGVKGCRWTGEFEELLRRGKETETFIHGGWMVNENLKLNFGPIEARIKVPLFKIGEQPLTSQILKRKTEFFAQVSPSFRQVNSDLFFLANGTPLLD